MEKFALLTINGKEFLATKLVRLNDIVYQELASADPLKPEFVYIEQSSGKIVTDKATFLALREKYCLDKRRLMSTPQQRLKTDSDNTLQ